MELQGREGVHAPGVNSNQKVDHRGKDQEETKFDCRLEKLKALLSSIRKNEKMNVLDFEVLDEKEKKKEQTTGKEVQGRSDGAGARIFPRSEGPKKGRRRGGGRQDGKESGNTSRKGEGWRCGRRHGREKSNHDSE